jgi:small subunit ribosomal protein S6
LERRLGPEETGLPDPKENTGFYHLFEYKVAGEAIAPFELEFRRDDSIMRYLTVKLDKHAAAWAEKRRERVKSSNPKK